MEKNDNTEQQNFSSSMCTAQCGFFGSSQFDGMCSKCFKDSVKRKNQPPADALPAGRASPGLMAAAARLLDTTPSVETGAPTVVVPKAETEDCGREVDGAVAATPAPPQIASVDEEVPASPSKPKKKNRCVSCRKKVGLTGFDCRCGGLFCSIHRYSDKHDCQFDYKKEGEDMIRKANPVIVGKKVEQI